MNYQALPVMTQTRIIKKDGLTIYYPELYGLSNLAVQEEINETIFELTWQLVKEQYPLQGLEHFDQIIGTYEIKTNERNIFSLSLSNYAISSQAAHGLTIMKSLTFNIDSGKNYTLADLFTPHSDYIELLSNHIQLQIKERDIPLLDGFTEIRPDQDFYIADKILVIYFQLYEITPYYIGLPMFPISVFDLSDIYKEDGPLGIMATNS